MTCRLALYRVEACFKVYKCDLVKCIALNLLGSCAVCEMQFLTSRPHVDPSSSAFVCIFMLVGLSSVAKEEIRAV